MACSPPRYMCWLQQRHYDPTHLKRQFSSTRTAVTTSIRGYDPDVWQRALGRRNRGSQCASAGAPLLAEL